MHNKPLEFQSTLPREERHRFSRMRWRLVKISIHAPTRGATQKMRLKSLFSRFQSTLPREERLMHPHNYDLDSIFQSTLPREERRQAQAGCTDDTWYFNPRSHERSDTENDTQPEALDISIHAPTRGATAILHKKFVYFYTIPTINI